MRSHRLPRQLSGLIMLVVLALIAALMLAFYTRAFSNPVEVKLKTARAGLIMQTGNPVKYDGVEVGRIGRVTKTASGALITLDIDRGQQMNIPANASAQIMATTIFGAKYVALSRPTINEGHIGDGSVIDASGVTTEVDSLFDNLDHLLTGINVAELNTTLTTLADTLRGRGGEIANLAHQADVYLTAFQPHLPQLRRDLAQTAEVAKLGTRITPQLVVLLKNATVSAHTATDMSNAIDRLLVDLAVLGNTGTTFVGAVGQDLQAVLHALLPTTDLAAAYAPGLPCFFQGLDVARHIADQAIGGVSPGLRLNVKLGSGETPYKNPQDLPSRMEGTGPTCEGLPHLTQLPAIDAGGN